MSEEDRGREDGMKGEREKYHANLASPELREVYKNIQDTAHFRNVTTEMLLKTLGNQS